MLTRDTVTTEQDNSDARHQLGEMTRRAKVVSRKVEMVDDSPGWSSNPKLRLS